MARKLRGTFDRILVLSDLHLPYGHKDALKFAKAIKKKYKPDLVILLGDEVDGHAISFHDSDPDLDSAGVELKKAKAQLSGYFDLFPNAKVCESNHGSLVYRRAKSAGLPKDMIKGYSEVLEAPKGWEWRRYFIAKPSVGGPIFFCHQKGANAIAASATLGMSLVQGHYHTKASVNYYNSECGLRFAVTCGCMIDDDSLAYEYNKLHAAKPVLTHLIIERGVPKLLPMFQNSKGRWLGEKFL